MGRNDFGPSNPRLPHRLEDGDAVRWLTKLETMSDIVQSARSQGLNVLGIRARVQLSTGEVVESARLAWRDLE